MSKMPNKDDLPALAEWLNQSAEELISSVLRKHTVGVLQAMRELAEKKNSLEARVAELEAELQSLREPDMFWDYDAPEDFGGVYADEFAEHISDNMDLGETVSIKVQCAKRLPNRTMKIFLDGDNETHWEWIPVEADK